MYETESDGFFHQLIKVIIAIVIFFVIIPLLLSFLWSDTLSSQEHNRFDDTNITYP